jgi:hypothetical protein
MFLSLHSDINMASLCDILESDFLKLLKFELNKKQALKLWGLYQSGSVKLSVWMPRSNDQDGLTKVFFCEKKKIFDVYILDSVLKSKYSCWRMSILLHELAHVLQYDAPALKTARQVRMTPKHGYLWKKAVKTSIKEGKLKNNAFLIRSQQQSCLYSSSSEKCEWC